MRLNKNQKRTSRLRPFRSGAPKFGTPIDGLCIIARPAYRVSRPLAGLPNPFPYGCSALCNHPRDPELKDVVWRSRLPTNSQIPVNFENSNRDILSKHRSIDEAPFAYNSLWRNDQSGNLLGEGFSNSTKNSAQLGIKRCASGGPSPSPLRRSPLIMNDLLDLDLRPWKSFDNVSNVADGQQFEHVSDNLERFELTSPRAGPIGRSRTIRRPETFSSKSYKEGKKIKHSTSKGSKQQQQKNATTEGNILSDYELDLSDTGQLDDDFVSILNDENEKRYKNDIELSLEDAALPDDLVNLETQAVQPQTELVEDDSNLQELEENLNLVHINDEEKLEEESEFQSDMQTFLRFPRASEIFGNRFELPIDLRTLKRLTSLEYLSRYVVATRCRQRLNQVVFLRHSKSARLAIEELPLALCEMLGSNLKEEELCRISQLVPELTSRGTTAPVDLSQQEFSGIAALAERISQNNISQRDDLESSDFNILQQKMSYLEMNHQLRKLLEFLCTQTFD